MRLSRLLRARRRIDERGAIAIIMALSITTLLVISAMVLDFGLVRADRQVNKSAADAATAAGLAGLGGTDGKPYPYRGVCSALRYLQKNDARFAGATSTAGTWTDGIGTAKANGCTDAGLRSQVCVPGTKASWAKYAWNGTWQGEPIRVEIQSGYEITGSGWQEESLPAVAADADDGADGCDQLAVTISQNRKPGLGSLATSSDLVSAIRTVGRVKPGRGGYAPAMLLLKRTGCPVLSTGGSGGGSYIHVYGALSEDGTKSQPGAIHADADGLNCTGGSGANILWGRAANGIVAYAAPKVGNPSVADPTKPGEISSVAVFNGVSATSGILRDSATNAYASGGLTEADTTAAKMAPIGRALVTRKPVDDRYLAGVHDAIATAQSTVFGSLTATNAAAQGYQVVSDCNPSAVTPTSTKLFIDCTDNNGYKGTAVLNAQTIVFNGRVNPSATVSMPNATKVYIFGIPTFPAIDIGSGATLSMHTAGNTNPDGTCTSTRSDHRAVLLVKDGVLKQSSGMLRLCNTTVLMMGGQPDGCLPAVGYTTTPAPMAKPCALASGTPVEGSGQLSQTGGSVDWTAPDQYDVMTLANGDPDPARAPAWSNPAGPEDLAFWSESGVSPSMTYNMTGGGNLHTVGVYMVPNADPFIIGGGANQVLKNAQYIATSIALNGNNTSISMSVDGNAAVPIGGLTPVGLVR